MNTHPDHLERRDVVAFCENQHHSGFQLRPLPPAGAFSLFFFTQSEIQPVSRALCKGQPPKRDLHEEGDYRHKIMQI